MLTRPGQTRRLYEFGPFRLDASKRRLLRESDPVLLTPKALETLIVLVENRAVIVSKDELMNSLWPDSSVEESNLSQNIFVLRKALGDSARERRYILTVPGRGYQFIETVNEIGDEKEAREACRLATEAPKSAAVDNRAARRSALWLAPALFAGLLAASLSWRLARHPDAWPEFKQRRLTANLPDNPVTHAAISPDGKYLGYSDRQGIHLQSVDTGQSQSARWPPAVERAEGSWDFESWYPDSTRFIARFVARENPASLWSVPLFEGTPVQLIGDAYGGSRVSSDGTLVAFLRKPVFLGNNVGDPYTVGAGEIWLMGSRGETPHRIMTAGDLSGFERIAWLPGADRIAYKYWRQQGQTAQLSVESRDLNGANRVTLVSNRGLQDFVFVSSDRLIYSQSMEGDNSDYGTDNLWELRFDPKNGALRGSPHRLTDWSGFSLTGITATASGRRLTFLRGAHHHSVIVGDLADHGDRMLDIRRLTTDDHSNVPLTWTPDSQEVIFLSRRTQVPQIYSQAFNGANPPRLISSAPPIDFEAVRLAPDRASLIARGRARDSTREAFYQLPVGGGGARLIFVPEGDVCGDFRCVSGGAASCAYQVESPDHRELIIKSFNLLSAHVRELLRIPVEPKSDYHWALSPNGLLIGLLKSEWGSNQIRFFSLQSGENRAIAVSGYAELRSLDWAPDSKSVFVGSSGPEGSVLLHIDLSGRTQPIWRQPQPLNTWGIASPDGRRLAIFATSVEANVWVMDGS